MKGIPEIPEINEIHEIHELHPYFYIQDEQLHAFFKVCDDLHLFAAIVDMDYSQSGEYVKVACNNAYNLTNLKNILEKCGIYAITVDVGMVFYD